MGPGRRLPRFVPLLLIWRVADLLLGRGRPVLRRALHPLTGALAGPVAAALSRQRRPLTRAVVLLALAISFAASTATFNATYAQQAEADAQLTNGADVTVTQAPGTPAPPGRITGIAAVPGVRAVEPVQHRFAYIVTDISTTRQIIGSSLTAVDLTGLTRVELTFALIRRRRRWAGPRAGPGRTATHLRDRHRAGRHPTAPARHDQQRSRGARRPRPDRRRRGRRGPVDHAGQGPHRSVRPTTVGDRGALGLPRNRRRRHRSRARRGHRNRRPNRSTPRTGALREL